MPIDLLSAFNKTTNAIANKSIIGRILGNPLWLGFCITLTVLLILWAWGLQDSVTFKLMFYTLVAVSGLVVAHDVILVDQIKECLETKDDVNMVKDVQKLGGYSYDTHVEPRKDMEQIRQSYTSTQLPSTVNANASPLSIDDLVNIS
jgi:hypothetical protein